MSKKGKNADLAPSRKEKKGIGQYVLGFFLLLYTLFCFLPVLLVFIAAFTDEKAIMKNGFSYFPEKWSTAGIGSVLKYGEQLIVSYGVTIFITVFGTLFGLLVMSMFAYSISRKDFRLSKFLSVYLLIPMLFNGGQLSGYVVFTSYYHLKDSLWLLILPLCVTTMNVIILRTYIVNSIPSELMEAAKIDGANGWQTLFKVTIPNVMPSITICTFLTLTNSFKLFDQNLALTGGAPSVMMAGTKVNMTELLALNIYSTYNINKNWHGAAQAKAVVFFLLVAVLAIAQQTATRKKEVQQ